MAGLLLIKIQSELNLSKIEAKSSPLAIYSSLRYFLSMITPKQIRGARAMLGLSQADLAKLAGMSTTGLNNIEKGKADPKTSTLQAIRAALENAGVQFIGPGDTSDGSGVALR